MKRALLLLPVLTATVALGADKWVGEINSSAGASTTNVSTATPFALVAGRHYSIQCNQNTMVVFAASGSVPVATTVQTGMLFVAQNTLFDFCTYLSSVVVAIIPASAGSDLCEVFQVPSNPGQSRLCG